MASHDRFQRWVTEIGAMFAVICLTSHSAPVVRAALVAYDPAPISAPAQTTRVMPSSPGVRLVTAAARTSESAARQESGTQDQQAADEIGQSLRSLTVLAVIIGWIAAWSRRKRGTETAGRGGRITGAALFGLIAVLWLAVAAREVGAWSANASSAGCVAPAGQQTPSPCHPGYLVGRLLFDLVIAAASGALAVRFMRHRGSGTSGR